MLTAQGEVGVQLGPAPGAFEKVPQRGYGLFMSTCNVQNLNVHIPSANS